MLSGGLRKVSLITAVALTLLSVGGLVGCKPTESQIPPLKKLTDAAVALRQNDGFLSKEDIDSLKTVVLTLKTAKPARVNNWVGSDGQVNIDSLAEFLVKEGIVQSKNAVLDPVPESFGVNLFIKNSANMYGYINPQSEFQEALFGLLVDLKASKYISGINIHHVNTVVSSSVVFDSDKVAVDHIHRIDRATFANKGKERGGNPGVTDFYKVFEPVLKTVDKGGVGILAADFILSPGKIDVNTYIERHKNALKAMFLNKIGELDKLDIAVLAFRMQSRFDGNYWNRKSEGVGRITAQRPYYIWFIGAPQHLAKISGNKRLMTTLKSNGYTGDYMIFESTGAEKVKEIEFKVAASEKYTVPIKDRHKIMYGKPPRKGDSTTIFVDVNFNDAFRDSSFFVNAVRVSDGYSRKIAPSKNPRFKYRLTLKSDTLIKGDVKIIVDGRIPEWVNVVNSEDDVDIKRNVDDEQAKTYQFKSIVEGVYSAFYPNISIDEPHVLQSVNLNVQLGK